MSSTASTTSNTSADVEIAQHEIKIGTNSNNFTNSTVPQEEGIGAKQKGDSTAKEKECEEEVSFKHDLQAGDHVIRWTRIVVYPIQIHGIVMSAGEDVVTIVDFGLSSAGSNQNKSKGKSSHNSIEEHTPLEEFVDNPENQEMISTIKENQKEKQGSKRINIITITDQEEIAQWKKVNYGEEIKQKKWKWWWQKDNKDANSDEKQKINGDDGNQEDKESNTNLEMVADNNTSEVNVIHADDNSKKTPTIKDDHQRNRNEDSNNVEEENNEKNKEAILPPKLPKSDPKHMVISRVRFLLEDPSVLPPHHIIYSNSECIAVWVKTGRWSTLQATVYLTSTAAGNFKSAATLATVVGTTTVTQTVPAGGIAGFFGMTTTTTVGLAAVQPWLIPAVAGYGIVAVGAPLFIMKKAREKWEENTIELTDKFWAWADVDVYVDAIKSWSAI